MNAPLVTICVPTYNAEKTIAETLRSLLNQTYTNFELFVVDNASTDATIDVVKTIRDDRITIIQHEKNIGAEASFEKCMVLGEGKYRAIYHADDLYDASMVEREVRLLEAESDIGAVLTRAKFINEQGRVIGISPSFSKLGIPEEKFFKLDLISLIKLLLRNFNFLFCPSAMARASVYDELKTWRGDLFKTSADLDVWLRIAESYGLALINKPLLCYRQSTFHGSYQINSARTTPADFFLVLDDWLGRKDIKMALTSDDHRCYAILKHRDGLECAARAFLTEQVSLAKEIYDQCGGKVYCHSRSLKGLKYLCLCVMLRIGFLVSFNKVLQKMACFLIKKILGR